MQDWKEQVQKYLEDKKLSMTDDKKKKKVNDNKISNTAKVSTAKASTAKAKASTAKAKASTAKAKESTAKAKESTAKASVTKSKQSTTNNNFVPCHDLIETNKEIGKCGIDHAMLENFQSEWNPLCFKNGNDLEGVMCHICSGDFTENHKKPSSRKQVYCCSRRSKGCKVVYCTSCFTDKLSETVDSGRRSRRYKTTTVVPV